MGCRKGTCRTDRLSQEDMRRIGCYGCGESYVEYARAKGSKHERLRMRCHQETVGLSPREGNSGDFLVCDRFTEKTLPDGIWKD